MAKNKGSATKQNKETRPPIVTIMGHVDHGKTSLLDFIRQSNLVSKEAGAITQHTGAYAVDIGTPDNSRKITFIDTPGHEAFAQMRSRGGMLADIVILIVSAEDGVKEQTKEAIRHIKDANVPMIVAINKIDLPNSDPSKVKQELAKEGVVVEELGGEIVCSSISAKTGEGVKDLLEMVLLLAEMQNLTVSSTADLEAVVVESVLSTQSGPISHVIIRQGTLNTGQPIYLGAVNIGKVRALFSDTGKKVEQALPADPVSILGLKEVLAGGSVITTVPFTGQSEVVLAESRETSSSEDASVLKVVLKADTRGTLEAVVASVKRLGDEEAYIDVVYQGVGDVTDSDVLLASAAKAFVVGFHVPVVASARDLAREMNVSVHTYQIIYELLDDLKARLKGVQIEEEFQGKGLAVVMKLFPLSSGDVVVGIFVTHGHVLTGDKIRVLREGEEVFRTSVKQIRILNERVKKVNKGQECGVLLRPQFDFSAEDIIEVL